MCKHYSPPLYQLSYGEIGMGLDPWLPRDSIPEGGSLTRDSIPPKECVIRESNPGPNVGNVRS